MEETIYISPPPRDFFFALISSFKNIVYLVTKLSGAPLSPAPEAGASLLPQPRGGWGRCFCGGQCPGWPVLELRLSSAPHFPCLWGVGGCSSHPFSTLPQGSYNGLGGAWAPPGFTGTPGGQPGSRGAARPCPRPEALSPPRFSSLPESGPQGAASRALIPDQGKPAPVLFRKHLPQRVAESVK